MISTTPGGPNSGCMHIDVLLRTGRVLVSGLEGCTVVCVREKLTGASVSTIRRDVVTAGHWYTNVSVKVHSKA